MQDALPQDNPGRSGSRSMGRMILIGTGLLLAVLIVVGIINDLTGEAAAFGPQQPFLVLAVLAFFGGALSFLSPCTLPILPAYFAFATSSGRRQIASNTMMFVLGLASVFSLLGASASAIGSLLRQFQDLILVAGGAIVVVFGVMSLLGKGFGGVMQEDGGGREATGLGGSFVFGMTFAAGWSSCIGPILGIMLTMAATTASVLRGGILLFIFALGLGIPLVVVSTFIGRANRQSFIWRMLRGKGWFVSVPQLLVGLVWGLAAWLILLAVVRFAFDNFPLFGGQEITAIHTYGILALSLAGGVLWALTRGGEGTETGRRTELHLHTTSLVSGVLFLALGFFMLSGRMTAITAELNNFTIQSGWYDNLVLWEEWLFNLFN